MTEQKMVCCVATGPMITHFSSQAWLYGKSETQNLSHRLTLGRNREPLNRRSCRSFRASFIWMVFFSLGIWSLFQLQTSTRLQNDRQKRLQPIEMARPKRKLQFIHEKCSDVRTFKHRKQWILVLTWTINGGLCVKKPMRAFNVAIKLCKD